MVGECTVLRHFRSSLSLAHCIRCHCPEFCPRGTWLSTQGSEDPLERPESTESATQLVQIFAAWAERGESQESLRSGIRTVMQEAWDGGAHFLITAQYRCCEIWGDGTPKNTHWEVISPPVMVVGAGSAEVTARVLPIPCRNREVKGDPRLLISSSADAEGNVQVCEEFLNFL